MPRKNNVIKHDPFRMTRNCQHKRRFLTQQQAEQAADDQMLIDMNAVISVYKCDICGNWHLTSLKKRD